MFAPRDMERPTGTNEAANAPQTKGPFAGRILRVGKEDTPQKGPESDKRRRLGTARKDTCHHQVPITGHQREVTSARWCWGPGRVADPARADHGRGTTTWNPSGPDESDFHVRSGGKGVPIFCHFYLGSPVEAPCPAMLLDGYLLSCCFVCRLRRDNTADWSRGNRVVMIRPDTRPRARPDPVSQDE